MSIDGVPRSKWMTSRLASRYCRVRQVHALRNFFSITCKRIVEVPPSSSPIREHAMKPSMWRASVIRCIWWREPNCSPWGDHFSVATGGPIRCCCSSSSDEPPPFPLAKRGVGPTAPGYATWMFLYGVVLAVAQPHRAGNRSMVWWEDGYGVDP